MITQAPSLARLIEFETASWSDHEQASPQELEKRLTNFPDGVFLLTTEGIDVAQVTASPKRIDLEDIASFEAMRDLPVDPNSKTLWVTNLATRRGDDNRGKGYGRELLTEVTCWAKEQGYHLIAAGVTCPGYAELKRNSFVSSAKDYIEQNLNSALNTFESAARAVEATTWHSTPIANYWPANQDSDGYGVLVVIDLRANS